MAYDPSQDTELQDAISAFNNADDKDKEATLYERTKQALIDSTGADPAKPHPWLDTFFDLPKNVTAGAYRALVSAADTTADAAVGLVNKTANGMLGIDTSGGDSGQESSGVPPVEIPTLSQAYPELMDHVYNVSSQIDKHETTSDSLTQGIVQFIAPFLGWMKAFNVGEATSKLGTVARTVGAEAATSATNFMPHDGRMADLVKRGTELDGKFGDLLRAAAPDGSLVNHYINYMTSRDGVTPDEKRNGVQEGEWEGRWKNAVDNTVTSAAFAGLIKSAGATFKGTRVSLGNMVPSADGSGRIGANAQQGMVAFHGTPHDFNEFKLDKLGTGEGHQAYGHGLYFAESKDVAGVYRARLSARGSDGPTGEAVDALTKSNGDTRKAYDALMKNAADHDAKGMTNFASTLRTAADRVKAGSVKIPGKLYTVDIPDEAAAKMLDFDKPLKDQPNILEKIPASDKQALESMLEDNGHSGDLTEYTGNELQQMIGRAIEDDRIAFTPADGAFDGNRKKYAADYFKAHDIPGIRFLDGKSRKAGDGTRNIVLFDDKLVKITKKE